MIKSLTFLLWKLLAVKGRFFVFTDFRKPLRTFNFLEIFRNCCRVLIEEVVSITVKVLASVVKLLLRGLIIRGYISND